MTDGFYDDPDLDPTKDTPSDDGEPGSILDNLGQLHDAIAARRQIPLEVPVWREEAGFPVVVVYRALEHERIRAAQNAINRAERNNPKSHGRVELEKNCDLLIAACVGIYAEVEGEKKSLRKGDRDGEWTRFDEDLAEALGLPKAGRTARMTCRKLFFTDGDVLTHAAKLTEFSGYTEKEVNEEFSEK